MKTQTKNETNENRFRVVIFGSARIEKGDPTWNLVYDLAKSIAIEGMDLVTGGGPGLMDAASEGHNAGDISHKANSIGLQIKLPDAQRDAHHIDLMKEFSRFSTRLDNFIDLANAVVVAPGGVGTLLELCYTWQLMQVKMISNIPIILIGDMWSAFGLWIKKWALKNKFLDQKDFTLLHLVDNYTDALEILKNAYRKNTQS
jgi:uncharacterized protein (TIGR00730 family)